MLLAANIALFAMNLFFAVTGKLPQIPAFFAGAGLVIILLEIAARDRCD